MILFTATLAEVVLRAGIRPIAIDKELEELYALGAN